MTDAVSAYLIVATVLSTTAHSPLHLLAITALLTAFLSQWQVDYYTSLRQCFWSALTTST